MDTIDYYNANASDYYNQTIELGMEDIIEEFIELIPDDGAILDLGCCSCRDSMYFIEEGFDINYGARPLKRLVSRTLETDLAKMIINGEIKFKDSVLVDYIDRFVITKDE